MNNEDKKFLKQLLIMLLAIILTLPVFLIIAGLFILGISIIFSLLVASLIMIATPLLAETDRSLKILVSGVPPMFIVYMGLSLVSLTVFLFLIYIVMFKNVLTKITSFFRKLGPGEGVGYY